MNIRVPEGKYVAAVSGGVDSVVLLDLLSNLYGIELIVAHFNHGIRTDADKDEAFVRRLAKAYGWPFEAEHGRLGANASEERAREARYKFLNQIKKKHGAEAIITAHHQDDLLETAIINIIRGTGRRGLTAIADNPGVMRPLLSVPKREILEYAKSHGLRWREDPSNRDETYLRNYVRLRVLPELSAAQRERLLSNIEQLSTANAAINQEIAKLSHKIIDGSGIDREGFITLPIQIAREVLMDFLRKNGITQFDRKTVDRLAVAIKTAKAGTAHDIVKGSVLEVSASKALLRTTVNR